MSKTGKLVLWLVILIVIIGIIVAATKDSAEAGPIKIGFIGPLTGDVVTLGTASKTAVEIAVKEINDAGGVDGRQVEVIYEDGKCAPTSAASASQKLIAVDKVSAIIGGLCSGETGSFVKNAMDSKIITMSYCSSAPTLTGSGKYFFRNYPSDAYAGDFIAEHLYNKGARKVAVLYPVSDYGTGIKDAFVKKFESLGGTISLVEGAQQSSRDYKTSLAKIKAANADYLFMPLYTEGGIPAIRQAKEIGLNMPIYVADTGSDAKFQKEIPADVEMHFVVVRSNTPVEFTDKVKAIAPDADVSICAPQAYDAAKIIASAMENVGLDGDKLQEEIRKMEYSGVSGLNKFDDNGDLVGAAYMVKKSKGGVVTDVQ